AALGEQQLASAGGDEHPDAPPLVEHSLVGEEVDTLRGGRRVDPVAGRELVGGGRALLLAEAAVDDRVLDALGDLEEERPALAHHARPPRFLTLLGNHATMGAVLSTPRSSRRLPGAHGAWRRRLRAGDLADRAGARARPAPSVPCGAWLSTPRSHGSARRSTPPAARARSVSCPTRCTPPPWRRRRSGARSARSPTACCSTPRARRSSSSPRVPTAWTPTWSRARRAR